MDGKALNAILGSIDWTRFDAEFVSYTGTISVVNAPAITYGAYSPSDQTQVPTALRWDNPDGTFVVIGMDWLAEISTKTKVQPLGQITEPQLPGDTQTQEPPTDEPYFPDAPKSEAKTPATDPTK